MTLNIDFTPQAEVWIRNEASRQGVPPTEVVRRLVEERLPDADGAAGLTPRAAPVIDAKTAAAIAYLDRRIAEASAATPEENRKAQEEWEELKRNLNANRAATGDHPVFP